MRIFDHHDGRVDHRADRDGNAAEAHDIGPDPEKFHCREGHQQSDRQHDDRHEGGADVQQKNDRYPRHDKAFFEQRCFQRLDCRQDQVGPVINRHDVDSFRQALGHHVQFCLGVVNHIQRICADPLKHDATGDLALTVQLGDAAAFIGNYFDPCDVFQVDRHPANAAQGDVADILGPRQIAASAHHEFELGQLHRAPAGVHVALGDGLADIRQRDPLRAHSDRVNCDRVLLNEATDTGHFGHALCTAGPETHYPILQRPQFSKAQVLAGDRILVDPAHPRCIRTKGWCHPIGQASRSSVEVFQHARPRPVRVNAVLEDDVDKRNAEERKAPHHAGSRHRQHGRGQRISDLVLHHLRGLARVVGQHDHLHVRQIGNSVDRQIA